MPPANIRPTNTTLRPKFIESFIRFSISQHTSPPSSSLRLTQAQPLTQTARTQAVACRDFRGSCTRTRASGRISGLSFTTDVNFDLPTQRCASMRQAHAPASLLTPSSTLKLPTTIFAAQFSPHSRPRTSILAAVMISLRGHRTPRAPRRAPHAARPTPRAPRRAPHAARPPPPTH
jgi:hypothetical protein